MTFQISRARIFGRAWPSLRHRSALIRRIRPSQRVLPLGETQRRNPFAAHVHRLVFTRSRSSDWSRHSNGSRPVPNAGSALPGFHKRVGWSSAVLYSNANTTSSRAGEAAPSGDFSTARYWIQRWLESESEIRLESS